MDSKKRNKLDLIRVISRIDIKGANVIKGVSFEGLRILGNPKSIIQKYYNEGIDEILLIDTVASLYGRNNLSNLLEEIVKDVFIPINIVGGISSLESAINILRSGADKIGINTAIVKNPNLLEEFINVIGSANVTVSIEAKKIKNDWEIYTLNGREKTGINIMRWIEVLSNFEIGEILLTSIDQDGTKKGFDCELIKLVSNKVKCSLIVSGGFGKLEHIDELMQIGNVDGIAIGTALHYNLTTIKSLKEHMYKKGFNVRV